MGVAARNSLAWLMVIRTDGFRHWSSHGVLVTSRDDWQRGQVDGSILAGESDRTARTLLLRESTDVMIERIVNPDVAAVITASRRAPAKYAYLTLFCEPTAEGEPNSWATSLSMDQAQTKLLVEPMPPAAWDCSDDPL